MKNSTAKQTISTYWRYMRRYPRKLVGAAISVPIATLLNNYIPAIIMAVVLERLAAGDFVHGQVWDSFGLALVAYGVISLLGGPIGMRVVDYFNWTLEGNVQRDIANDIYKHMIDQDTSFHADRFGGSLVSQTNKFLGSYVRIVDVVMYQIMPMVSGVIFAGIILAKRAPLFVVALFIVTIVYIIVALVVTRKARTFGRVHSESESRQTGYLADSIANVMTIKSFAHDKQEEREFGKKTSTTRQSLLRLFVVVQRQLFVFSTLSSLMTTLSLVIAVISVMAFSANIATVFLILNYTILITTQLFAFSNQSLRAYNRAIGDAAEMTEILAIQPKVLDPAKPEKIAIKHGVIDFRDVDFQYNDDNTPLFDGLNLNIKPGEKVGLVGHSGGGKTTITKLLLRFMDIQGGAILVDGQDITAITQNDLRSHIAYVPQEPLLFHRSLLENIRYGKSDATEAEVMKAAKLAHAHEFIKDLPNGYETLVGERGVKLSGGQRQRVAIARAMLKNAPILLLDEATSALDSESEKLIQDALWKLMEGRTSIVIAHRLSTIQHMDRIVVLDKGAVVEEGSHKDLIKKNGLYAKLWAHQSGGFIED